MKILMLAPQPFLEERGAPFAIYHHSKALLSMGYEIDLVTYHIGKAVDLPGLRILRIPALSFIRQVKVGPSLAKIPLDMLLFALAFWRLCVARYDCIHSHEEAGVIGVILSAIFGCKHLYYMHSDLSQQVVSSNFTANPLLIKGVGAVQRWIVQQAHAIIAICPDIEATAKRMTTNRPVYLIENAAVDEGLTTPTAEDVQRLRAQLDLGNGPVLLYTGTLESYQGIEILLHSVAVVCMSFPNVRYLLVGGQAAQIERLRALAQELGVAEVVCFVGQRPLAEMPAYMALADILLSPRSKGTNTPLKLYTYLRTGKPILATGIYSQTQLLTSAIALLVEPTPDGLAQGAIELLKHPQWAKDLGERGRLFAEERYSWQVFLHKSKQVQQSFHADILNSAA